MANSCPYCAQTDTHKDRFGYCKKYACFEISGDQKKYNELKRELSEARLLPKTKYNYYDNQHHEYRDFEVRHIQKKIVEFLGFLPIECHEHVIIL